MGPFAALPRRPQERKATLGDRLFVDAVIFHAKTGIQWRDLPERFGNWKSVRGHADRADRLARAAESVVRNIAEGAGRWSEADSANRYKIACEAMECAASLDIMKLRKVITDARHERGSELLAAVC